MGQSLGILVTTDRYLDYVINLTEAACKKGKEVQIFFTGRSVKLILDPAVASLASKAGVNICDASFRSHDLDKEKQAILECKVQQMTTQAKNSLLIALCDRYVVF